MPFSSEEWEEISQTIPSTDEPFLQKYIDGRDALIAQEAKQRSGLAGAQGGEHHGAPGHDVLPVQGAHGVDAAVEDHPADAQGRAPARPPRRHGGLHFSDRPAAQRAGNAHHGRPAARLASRPGRRQDRLPLPQGGADRGRYLGRRLPGRHADPADAAADAFPEGGRQGFFRWLYSRCSLSRTDAVAQHHGIDEIWSKFFNCFRVVETIIHYEPIFRAFLRRLMRQLKDDGVNYAELRFSWGLDYFLLGSEAPEPDYVAMMDTIDEEVAAFQATPEGRGFWGLRMIWATIRSQPRRDIVQSMDHCITTKITHPHLIAGYDLVGQEDLGRPLRDMLPELFWFRKQCADEGVNVPFFFHAGECLGTGSETDQNLYDAILLGTRRIGHGFSLYKHPLLIDLVKDKKILIESCPISNEVLRLCGSVMSHPLPALLARGVACSLCNDDPAMLGQDTAGSTHDFWQALQGWDNLGLAGLGSLAENSVRWAAFEDQTQDEWSRDIKEATVGSGLKAQRLKEWAVEWEKFCLWIVTEFGDQE
ncbi:hypothetical protein G7054_g15036 [Neopestalotiopsis clavispora]|nr:hypothetical protein G7054_g15036 [Neopestalotiopsis clavispora]